MTDYPMLFFRTSRNSHPKRDFEEQALRSTEAGEYPAEVRKAKWLIEIVSKENRVTNFNVYTRLIGNQRRNIKETPFIFAQTLL